VGSLIKNPGGCIARCGGLIAGRRDLIEKISFRATVPGLGREVGATMGTNRELFMGLFNAPQATAHALKTAEFTARLMTLMGFDVTPRPGEVRADIVQCLLLGNRQNLINYCRGIQAASPVDSHLTPEPWDMPGYDDQVVMAAGTFTSGSSAEISCDAPLREPFAAWQQGGINYDSARYAVMNAASMLERGT
ncbi:MAG: methionine gamma-lyase family protein, partial [Clostridia bacterium]|nr:methionine gamma-lyase family protein [Clostridia bacterium]